MQNMFTLHRLVVGSYSLFLYRTSIRVWISIRIRVRQCVQTIRTSTTTDIYHNHVGIVLTLVVGPCEESMIPVTMGSLCTVTCGSYLLHELVVVDGPVFRHRSDVGLLGRLGEAEQRELGAGVLAQSSLWKQHVTTGYSPFTLTVGSFYTYHQSHRFLSAAPLIFLTSRVNSTMGLHWTHF